MNTEYSAKMLSIIVLKRFARYLKHRSNEYPKYQCSNAYCGQIVRRKDSFCCHPCRWEREKNNYRLFRSWLD